MNAESVPHTSHKAPGDPILLIISCYGIFFHQFHSLYFVALILFPFDLQQHASRETIRGPCLPVTGNTHRKEKTSMNWAHVHLIINHFPVVGSLFGVLLLLYALLRKNEEVKKLGLGFLVLIALVTIPVYYTGHAGEEIVVDLPGVTKSFINDHADMALVSYSAVLLLGIVSFGGLIFFRHAANLPQWFMVLSLGLTIIVAGLIGLTANIGGQIRHTEARKDFQVPAPTGKNVSGHTHAH